MTIFNFNKYKLSNSFSLNLVILVLSVINNPTLCSREYKLVEESPAGSYIANLTRDLNIDKESRENLKIINWKGENGQEHFSVNKTTGILYVKSPPDREKICKKVERCIVPLSIGYGNRHDPTILTVSIELEDINDNSPFFADSKHNEIISENVESKSIVLPSASDPDKGENGSITYELINIDNAPLTLEPPSGEIPKLRLTKPLDYEKTQRYRMEIIARDKGIPSRSSTLSVVVNVKDENDHAPVFIKTMYDVTIKEDVKKDEIILDIVAEDKDSGRNGDVSYRIAEPTTAEEREAVRYFSIHTTRNMGKLYVREKIDIDRRNNRQFVIAVEATDNGQPKKTSRVKVIIRVEDINDFTPQISISYNNEEHLDKNIGYVLENIERSFIGQVTVVDYDSGSGGEVRCSLDDSGFILEEINQSPNRYQRDFKLMSILRFDRETQPRIQFKIECVDNVNSYGSQVQLTGTTTVNIQVLDQNDMQPRFTKALYQFNVLENTPKQGTSRVRIGEVRAEDNDLDQNAKVKYSLINNPSNAFSISTMGTIYIHQSFDRETTPVVNFTVKATDGKFSTTARVMVKFLDENDCSPTFLTNNYVFSVSENSRTAIVGTVKAQDLDEDKNITYSIEYSRNKFYIDRRTGEIRLHHALDREEEAQYVFHVLATDSPSIRGYHQVKNTGTATVTVNVLDENDNNPIINYPSSQTAISTETGLSPGHELFTMAATDIDKGENSTIKYRIFKGGDGLFEVDRESGLVYLTKKLPETERTYLLVLVAEDDGRPFKRNNTVTVRISAQPRNDLPKTSDYNENIPGSLTNKTILIILSTIFFILLLTTFLLIYLIKRRRDVERHKFRGVKCQYGKSLKPEEHSMNATLNAEEKLMALHHDSEKGGAATLRLEHQEMYSPLQLSGQSPMYMNQDGERVSEKDNKQGNIVFWCSGTNSSQNPVISGTLASNKDTLRRPYFPHAASDYQTLDTSMLHGKQDLAGMYYEIGLNKQPSTQDKRGQSGNSDGDSLLTSPHYQTFFHTLGREEQRRRAMSNESILNKEQGGALNLRNTSPHSEGDTLTVENQLTQPWQPMASSVISKPTSLNMTNRRKTEHSPYAEASFV